MKTLLSQLKTTSTQGNLFIVFALGVFVALTVLSCVNDDPDGGELSRQFLMGNVTANLSPGLAGGKLKKDTLDSVKKSRRLQDGAVVAGGSSSGSASASGKSYSFFDSADLIADTNKRTVMLTSSNTNELLLILPADTRMIIRGHEEFVEEVLKDNTQAGIRKAIELEDINTSGGEGEENFGYFDTYIAEANINGFFINPTLAKEIFINGLFVEYKTFPQPLPEEINSECSDISQPPANNVTCPSRDPDDPVFQTNAHGDGLVAYSGDEQLHFNSKTYEIVENGESTGEASGVSAFELAKKISGREGDFKCTYVVEDGETLYYALQCEMEEKFYKKMLDLRKLRNILDEAMIRQFQKEAEMPDLVAAEMKKMSAALSAAFPGTSFWVVGIPVDELTKQGLNRISSGDNLKLFTTPKELASLLFHSDYKDSDFVRSLTDLRKYIGYLAQTAISESLGQRQPGMPGIGSAGGVEAFTDGADFYEDSPDFIDDFGNYDGFGKAMPDNIADDMIQHEQYLLPFIFEEIVKPNNTSHICDKDYANRVDFLQTIANDDTRLPEENEEATRILGALQAGETRAEVTAAFNFFCDEGGNTDAKDYLTNKNPSVPVLNFYSYEFFDMDLAKLLQQMGDKLE